MMSRLFELKAKRPQNAAVRMIAGPSVVRNLAAEGDGELADEVEVERLSMRDTDLRGNIVLVGSKMSKLVRVKRSYWRIGRLKRFRERLFREEVG